MAEEQKSKEDLKLLAENLRSLRKQARIKIKGIEAYTGKDGSHYRKYENSDNTITPNAKTLVRFAKLYGVSVEDLFEKQSLVLGSELTELEQFKKKFGSFSEYFMNTLSVPDFIRIKLFPLNEMQNGLTISEILELFPDEPVTSKSLSRELTRMVNKGKLKREDSSGKGSVYIYKLI